MITDLDKTIEELLSRELVSIIGMPVSICFDVPDGNFPPSSVTLPAIDLFLYDIRENTELRSNE